MMQFIFVECRISKQVSKQLKQEKNKNNSTQHCRMLENERQEEKHQHIYSKSQTTLHVEQCFQYRRNQHELLCLALVLTKGLI